MKHEPALDGLRGVAVLGVVCFHAGFSWAVGGYLGVSTFFTLSGFLITTLLLREARGDGVALGSFWSRRARRLLPASLLCLVGVAALAPVFATAEQLASLRGDVLAALAYVANWRFVVSGQSYGDLFSAPSPLLHFWSLAIEEQLYVVVPLLVVVLGRRRVWAGFTLLLAASLVVPFFLSNDDAYYFTPVRAGELVVGSLLACWLFARSGRENPRDAVVFPPRTVAIAVAGVVALGVLLWAWTAVEQSTWWLYRGGFVGHAVLSAVVIVAATADGGPVRWALSLAPLQWLGRVSYGVYLFHWPLFIWMDEPFVVEVACALALATASYVVIEQPIRRQRVRVPVPALLVPTGVVLCAAVAVASTLDPPSSAFGAGGLTAASPALEQEDYVPPAPTAPVVVVFGDSTALRTAFALKGWGWITGRIDMRDGDARVGCPLARGGEVDFVSRRSETEPGCRTWDERWRSIVASVAPDVALVQVGPWDVTDRRLDGADEWTHIGEPAYDAYLESEMHAAVDALSSSGALVVWLTSPHIQFGLADPTVPDDHPISDPARMDRLNALIRRVDAARDEMVVLDLQAHLAGLPGGELDPSLRPDGVHFSEEASKQVAEWLGPALIELAANRQDASGSSS